MERGPKPFVWKKTSDEILSSLAQIYEEDFRRNTVADAFLRRGYTRGGYLGFR